jgi:hypothetical protein
MQSQRMKTNIFLPTSNKLETFDKLDQYEMLIRDGVATVVQHLPRKLSSP